jgi:hypothetical protein
MSVRARKIGIPSTGAAWQEATARKGAPRMAIDDTNSKEKLIEQGVSIQGDPNAIGKILKNDSNLDADTFWLSGWLDGRGPRRTSRSHVWQERLSS